MQVLILGASARAAAHSSIRAGWKPIAADLFADRDLSACCSVDRVQWNDYPQAFEVISQRLPTCPWFYTGALENHPELVDRISRNRPLIGCTGSVLAMVRDPFVVGDLLFRRGLPCPEVLRFENPPANGEAWLRKPLASASGAGISVANANPLDAKGDRYFFQKRMNGDSFSALFITIGRTSKLLGVCRQIVGDASNPFRYRGGAAPWPVSSSTIETLGKIGESLVEELGVCWLFGIDFILEGEVPWPVEVNPRYTASVELYERAAGRPLLADPIAFDLVSHKIDRVVGKLIIRAPCDCEVPANWLEGVDLTQAWRGALPFADLPAPGERFKTGEPVLTIFAEAKEPHECLSMLERLKIDWHNQILTWKSLEG